MRFKSNKKEIAIRLRKKGYSYNQIVSKLGIGKSTCSLWLRGIKLDDSAIQKLVERQDVGRKRAALTLRQYRAERDGFIRQRAETVLRKVRITPEGGKLLCAMLYWGEGSKDETELRFTNSDPSMVTVYLELLRRYFDMDETKLKALLHLHSYHDVNKQKLYWSKATNIPMDRISIYKKVNSGKNIRPGYPGCISVRYYDVRLVKEMKFLYTALIEKLGGVV